MKTVGRIGALVVAGIAAGGCPNARAPPPATPPAPVAAAPAPPPALRPSAYCRSTKLWRPPRRPCYQARTAVEGAAGVVIDPLIDAVSGMESQQTRLMEKRIVELAKEKFPQFDVQPFNVASVAKLPIVLVGTFTPIDSKNKCARRASSFVSVLLLRTQQRKDLVEGCGSFAARRRRFDSDDVLSRQSGVERRGPRE